MKTLSANWVAGDIGDDGRFEVLVITQDGERHILSPSPVSTIALVALAQADTELLWDPEGRTLIAANVVGQMPWTVPAEPETPDRGAR